MTGLLLPIDDMTPDERRGFRMALGCLATWGHQIERESVRLGGTPHPVDPVHLMQVKGQFLRHCAEALDLTLGRAPRAAPSVSLAAPPPRRLRA